MLTTHSLKRFFKVNLKLFLGLAVVVFVSTAQAQNTKGDKPATTSAPAKESKGKLFGKMRSGKARPGSSRSRIKNVFPQSGPFVNNPSREPSKTPRSNPNKTVAGKRVTAPRSSSGRITNVYPQRGPYVNNPSRTPKTERPNTTRLPSAVKSTGRRPTGIDKAWTMRSATGQSTTPRSVSARIKSSNVYSQKGPFVNNPSTKPRRPDASPRNQPLNKSRNLTMSKAAAQARSMGMRGAGFQTITAQFLTRGKNNVYWGKFRKKEQAVTKDIAGRKLRTLNYHSPKMGLVGRDTLPFFRRTPRNIKRTPSAPLGGYQSATRTGKAWSGNISGDKIRKPAARGNREKPGKFVWPRKLSVTAKGERSGKALRNKPQSLSTKKGRASATPIPARPPGNGGPAMLAFSKRSQGRKVLKGAGGSVSGKVWNNKNQPVPGKGAPISSMRISGFSGNGKSRRPSKGGGSVSGQIWNNRNQPVTVRRGGAGTIQAAQFRGRKGYTTGREFSQLGLNFTGGKKASRPLKGGGGSISGRIWNNDNRPIDVRTGGQGTRMAGMYSGTIKTKRPVKGGGSVSGRIWNNDNNPIDVRTGGRGTRMAGMYAGNIKAKRPLKGGGSISGQPRNNRNQPIVVRTGGEGSRRGGLYGGNIKYQKKPETAGKSATFSGKIPSVIPGGEMSPIGLNYDGDSKAKKKGIDNKPTSPFAKVFKRGKTGMLPATHINRDEQMASYAQRGKRSIFNRYVQNPKADDESLKKDRAPDGLRLKVPILSQTKRSVNAGHYTHVMKQYWDYKHAPNSAKEALKVREPGKANAHIGDLQVNVKMKKHVDAAMHPDAKFAHSLRDNVKAERTLLMNVRLTWAKLFKKSDNQPRNLKEKPSRPRYDPGEKDLWYK
jgi:hypothetical protein